MKFPRLLHRSRSSKIPPKPLLMLLVLILLAAGWSVAEAKDDSAPGPTPTPTWNGRWSEEVLDVVAKIPVQSQGRIKPLHTWAGFTLLGSNHRRSCKDADDN